MRLTQRQRIIEHIRAFGSITSWDAYSDLGITQFITRVKELKEDGYEFTTKKIQIDRYVFDIIAEGQRYRELALLERAGKISDLKLQPRFLLQESFRKNGKTYLLPL